jgi:hypothetical protein
MEKSVVNIPVKNAGLVLLNSYYPVLFERTGLIRNFTFMSPAMQQRAALYLQFVATGNTNSIENHLTLNHVLCGVDPDTLFSGNTAIPEEHKTIVDSLLNAAISQWTAINTTTKRRAQGELACSQRTAY